MANKLAAFSTGKLPPGAASTLNRIAPETRSQNTNAPGRTGVFLSCTAFSVGDCLALFRINLA